MAFVKVGDDTSEMDVTLFSKEYADFFPLLNKNNVVLISGRVDKYRKDTFVCTNMVRLEN